MATFQAKTLSDTIETNWALTGALTKVKTSTRTNIVKFFGHPQAPETENKKAVYVKKQTPLNSVVHYPRYDSIRDTFELQCRYTAEFAKKSAWDNAEERVEDMCEEVVRIVKTVYDPQTSTGVFWTTSYEWRNDDQIDLKIKVLRRTLVLHLTYLKSRDTTVFEGNSGVLTFDLSETVADSKPSNDYIYTEVFDVDIGEGYGIDAVMTNDVTQGQNVPVLFSTMYAGQIRFIMRAKKADLNVSTVNALYKMFLLQASSPLDKELPTITLLSDVDNTESPVVTFRTSSSVKIIDMRKRVRELDLVEFTVTGMLTKPSTVSFP